MLGGMTCLHVSPDDISGKLRVRGDIDCVPLCWGKSPQCWLMGEFCCCLVRAGRRDGDSDGSQDAVYCIDKVPAVVGRG